MENLWDALRLYNGVERVDKDVIFNEHALRVVLFGQVLELSFNTT